MVAPSSSIKMIMIFYITDKSYILILYNFQACDVADYRDIMSVSELLEYPSYVEELKEKIHTFLKCIYYRFYSMVVPLAGQ